MSVYFNSQRFARTGGTRSAHGIFSPGNVRSTLIAAIPALIPHYPTDLHKNYRPNDQNEVVKFLEFVYNIYTSLPDTGACVPLFSLLVLASGLPYSTPYFSRLSLSLTVEWVSLPWSLA